MSTENIGKLMFIGEFARTKWREPYLVGRCLGAAENVRFIGCYGGSKPPPYGFVRKSNTPINQNLKGRDLSRPWLCAFENYLSAIVQPLPTPYFSPVLS